MLVPVLHRALHVSRQVSLLDGEWILNQSLLRRPICGMGVASAAGKVSERLLEVLQIGELLLVWNALRLRQAG